MSALEIIEQIKVLPPKERAEVVEFLRKIESPSSTRTVEHMADDVAQASGNKVLRQYKDVFEKLAQ